MPSSGTRRNFCSHWQEKKTGLRKKIEAGRKRLKDVAVPDSIQEQAAALCLALKTDGLRGQLTLIRAARALAAFEKQKAVTLKHIKRMALPALRHRLRRNPLEETARQCASNVRFRTCSAHE